MSASITTIQTLPQAPTGAVSVFVTKRHRSRFGVASWVAGGFGLIPAAFRRQRAHGKGDEVVVYTVHRSFFLWLLILTGFVAAWCAGHYPASAHLWGWVYVWVLMYTLVTFLFDVSTPKLLLWTGIAAFIWVVSLYLEELKHLTMLSAVISYIQRLRPALDPGFASVISWLLLIPWIGSLFHTFSRGRKTFSPNSIEEYYLGEGREILDRAGLKFRSRYRDLFETVLGLGAGDLEAIDGNGHVAKRWENILFLAFAWRRLDQILHQRAATVDNSPGDPVEVEDVHNA